MAQIELMALFQPATIFVNRPTPEVFVRKYEQITTTNTGTFEPAILHAMWYCWCREESSQQESNQQEEEGGCCGEMAESFCEGFLSGICGG
uniref:Uncharacterized protein n=1 Tax=Acrobeloides nanus TaxID=290746 RepID=A0A914DZL9_9BILA